jgi:hypothetical protein
VGDLGFDHGRRRWRLRFSGVLLFIARICPLKGSSPSWFPLKCWFVVEQSGFAIAYVCMQGSIWVQG